MSLGSIIGWTLLAILFFMSVYLLHTMKFWTMLGLMGQAFKTLPGVSLIFIPWILIILYQTALTENDRVNSTEKFGQIILSSSIVGAFLCSILIYRWLSTNILESNTTLSLLAMFQGLFLSTSFITLTFVLMNIYHG